MTVLLSIAYLLLAAAAVFVAFIIIRTLLKALELFFTILPQYLAHTLSILFFVAIFAGLVLAVVMLSKLS